ncbi:hypothetical protein D3C87_1956050 [compost metagenome]
MIEPFLKGQKLVVQLFIFTDDALIILDDLIQKFVDLILIITADSPGEFLVMYIEWC